MSILVYLSMSREAALAARPLYHLLRVLGRYRARKPLLSDGVILRVQLDADI